MKCRRMTFVRASSCRSPCGERGLKLMVRVNGRCHCKSLPVRGAWVEMSIITVKMVSKSLSLPVRGAWVEIPGERAAVVVERVAPRAGSVG